MKTVVRIIRKIIALFHIYLKQDGWRSYTRYGDGNWNLAGFKGKETWRDMFCADPFLFRHDGANWLFYETVLKGSRKGVIGCLKEVDGEWVQQGKVLEQPWHMSYPQVFEEEGHIYMIPEESDLGNGSVNLYEATDFPRGWKKTRTLINRPFADATILKYDGHWYMACYMIPPNESAELWHAPTLFGPWEQHPMWNAINQSRRLRRCGGSFIFRDGRLCRVAQDCNGFYGKRLFLVPVLEISPTVYREGRARLLWDKSMPPCGYCHTYNEMEVDGRRLSVVDVHCDEMKPLRKMIRDIVRLIRGGATNH